MLRIVPISNNQYYSHYIDGFKVDGKRKRVFYASLKDAKAGLKRLETQLRQEGEKGLGLEPADRILAARATELLRPFDKTVLDAARFYVEHLESLATDVRISALVDQYIESKRYAKFSRVYIEDIQQRLGRFNEFFGTRLAKSLKVGEIEQWLHGLGFAPLTINNYRAIIRAFFAYAVKRGRLDSNPIDAIHKIRFTGEPPEIFRPEELSQFLVAAPTSFLPSLAIGAFAGLRTSELLRLDWKEVDLVRGFVHVASAKTKTARRRLVKMQPSLVAWLQPFARKAGNVYPGGKRHYHYAIEKLSTTVGIKWPQNGLRHSFASYHLAKFQNAHQLALELGHSTTRLIFEHYRELVTPEAADRYWAIIPAELPANVVQMEATR
jgi:integrase